MNKVTRTDTLNRYANLIERQAGRIVRPYRSDGFVNLLTKYGTEKDLSEHYQYQAEPVIPDEYLSEYYEGDGLFARIIDAPAEEAIKNGFTLKDLKGQKLEEFYNEALDDLDWEETVITAIKWARLFGGSLAVMLIDDGRGLEEPLDWKHIKSIDDIRVYERSLVQPIMNDLEGYEPDDPFGTRGSRTGMPEYYDVFSRTGNFRVHDSRCLVFQNGLLPENTINSVYQLWGMPEYVRINQAIKNAEIAHGIAPKLLDRSVQAIYKMKDLSLELASEGGEDRLLKRLQLIDMSKGFMNSIAIDSEGEEYDYRTFQFAGVSDVINTTCNYLSALTNIPQTILFGRSPAGMNATGSSDFETWYNYLSRIQKRMIRKNLRYLLSIIFQAGVLNGDIDEVPPIKVEFNPLWSMSEQEQAQLDQLKASTQQTKAATAAVYVDMQAIDPTEVRKKLAESEEFDVENLLDDFDEEELFPEDQLEVHAPSGQQGGEAGGMPGMPGAPGGGEQMGGGNPMAMMGGMAEETPTENPEKASETAPTDTKPPQDMNEEEKEGYKKTEQQNIDKEKGKAEALRTSESERPYKMEKEEEKENEDDEVHEDSEPTAVGVICIKDGKILCGTRHNTTHYGKVCGPGGWIDEGETPEEAAVRESEEEFGIKPMSLMRIGEEDRDEDGGKPVIFLCTDWEGEPTSTDMEMVNPRFMSVGELKQLGDDLFAPFINSIRLMERTLTGEEWVDPEEVDSIEQLRKYIMQFD